MQTTFIAKTFFGLEQVLAVELEQIGATDISVQSRAVAFTGDDATMYAANIYLRSALRILKPIYTFDAENDFELYNQAREFAWENYLTKDQTFAIDNTVYSEFFSHSEYAVLKTKDAIADYFRDKYGERPSVNKENPDILFNLHIHENKVTISLDSSGESLHKRGYRTQQHIAPLNEVLAAGMILLSGWNKSTTFFDPMCGSGTLPIEAALMAYNIAPGLIRKEYAFKKWNNYNDVLYKKLLLDAASQVQEKNIVITGSDNWKKAIDMAREHAIQAKLEDKIHFFGKSFEETDPPKIPGVVIINPPYGERLAQEDVNVFYKMIGDTFKKKYAGYTAWILSSNSQAVKNIGLKPSAKITLYNGKLECRFLKFDMYDGSRKRKTDTDV